MILIRKILSFIKNKLSFSEDGWKEVAINEECITFQHTITITNSLVVKRRTDILTTHSISETTMRAWLKKNHFMISQSLSSYKDNARMDQSTVIQL